jgi:uncharacterized protein
MTDHPAEPGFEALHPNARWSIRLGAVLASAALLAGVGAGLLLPLAAGLGLPIAAWLRGSPWVIGVLLLAALPLGWWYARLAFARVRYRLDCHGLEIRRGVWWRRQTRIPRSRIQHTDLHSGPIDRWLGLATLKVYTAGTRLASVDLGGLPASRAVELRDALLDGHDDSL